MTDSELAEVKMLQEKFHQKVFQVGQWCLQRWDAEARIKSASEQETKLKDEWTNLQKMENEMIEKLLDKYGEGALDLQAGTFIPENKPVPAS